MHTDDLGGTADVSLSGRNLFFWCQAIAHQYRRAFHEQSLLPSGARIFYYTRLALLRRGYWPAIEPNEEPVLGETAEQFHHQTLIVAEQLKTDFGQAIQLLVDPYSVLRRWLGEGLLPSTTPLREALEYLEQLPRSLATQHPRPIFPAAYQIPQLEKFSPAWILVAPIAHPRSSNEVALRLLEARLVQDETKRGWIIPAPEVYLYDEPLVCWCRRRLEESSNKE